MTALPSNRTNQGRSLENIKARAMQARRTGRWPGWRHHAIDGAPNSMGWGKEFTRCSENGVFVVMIRDLDTAWGKMRHAMISVPVDGIEPTWSERQRIKNELLGRGRTAIEVFPSTSDLVDCGKPVYHLWVLPEGMQLPFTIATQPSEGEPASTPDQGDAVPPVDPATAG